MSRLHKIKIPLIWHINQAIRTLKEGRDAQLIGMAQQNEYLHRIAVALEKKNYLLFGDKIKDIKEQE